MGTIVTKAYFKWREPEGEGHLVLHPDGTPLVGTMGDLVGCHYTPDDEVVDNCDFGFHLNVGDWWESLQSNLEGKRQHQPFHMWSVYRQGSCVDGI